MWYVSGVDWVHADLPRYNIKYAKSSDGVNWVQNAVVAIDSRNEHETSLARPCVFKEGGIYRVARWRHMDDQVGISRSATGWDSKMIEYGAVFSHRGNKYMLFNGNGYGTSGAGLAILHD